MTTRSIKGFPKMRDLSAVPKALPQDGRVLVHNHVRPAHPPGMNGFRIWLQTRDDPDLEPCPCGWAASLGQHYRIRR